MYNVDKIKKNKQIFLKYYVLFEFFDLIQDNLKEIFCFKNKIFGKIFIDKYFIKVGIKVKCLVKYKEYLIELIYIKEVLFFFFR